MNIDSISSITPSKVNWCLKLKIVRQWRLTHRGLPKSIEMVFMDEHGDKIHNVIGVLTKIGGLEEFTVNGKVVKLVRFDLSAVRTKIECVLIAHFVDEYIDFVSTGHALGVVVLIQLCRVKTRPAQLANHRLVLFPFFSAFVSLKFERSIVQTLTVTALSTMGHAKISHASQNAEARARRKLILSNKRSSTTTSKMNTTQASLPNSAEVSPFSKRTQTTNIPYPMSSTEARANRKSIMKRKRAYNKTDELQ
ncbi:uncharacterized protein LOC130737002 [Lotus japonicus]|uniref:uncharacterized protein LOC130737002 n=1 Tax=Lotus japonicus TaxID=34305 RepID=UPI00258EA483|nr:uncharacterized protein LOC130737002 [Lotus japonicus]